MLHSCILLVIFVYYTMMHRNMNIKYNGGFNLLKTKRRPLYLKTQSVPRSKHFSSRL